MFRKIALGLFAVVAVTAASLAPAAAKGGFHIHHGHHGHWGGWGGGFYNSSAYYVGSNCYQQIVVQTHRGPRLRVVNTCGYVY